MKPTPEQIERNRVALTEALRPFAESIYDIIDAELARPPHPMDCFIAGMFWLGCAVAGSMGAPECIEARLLWLGEVAS